MRFDAAAPDHVLEPEHPMFPANSGSRPSALGVVGPRDTVAVRLAGSGGLSATGTWLLRWKAGERKTVYLCIFVFALGATLLSLYARAIWNEYAAEVPGHPAEFGDFFALWSYAKIVVSHPAIGLYDLAALHTMQISLGMDPGAQNPFPYPPVFILFLWPLGLVPYDAAYPVWVLATFALYFLMVSTCCSRLPICTLGLILAPESTYAIASGQSGFLAGALIVGGLRFAGSRPVLAGILMGVLCYKPQLGLLVPVALAAAGYWTCFAAAAATVIGLCVTVTIVFGWAIWSAWISMTPAYAQIFDGMTKLLKLQPTVLANLRMEGLALPAAKCVQALAAVTVAVLIWRCFRRRPGRLAVAALLVGTFLATPHAFVYDLPMVTAAIALFIQQRTDAAGYFNLAEVLVLTLAFLFPVFMVANAVTAPTSTAALGLLFGLIVWRQSQSRAA
jgi:hypothetical protein